LEAAEAAVLSGDYRQARTWLAPILQDTRLDSTFQAVAHFYQFWLVLVEGHIARDDFDKLKQSLSLYAQSRTADSPAWSFLGARAALEKAAVAKDKKKVLQDILEVFEHPEKGAAHLRLPS
jgi:hypothetical protein